MRVLAFLLVACGWLGAQPVRLNQIQVLGSHNSYKEAIDPSLRQILRETMGERLKGLEYSHLPLGAQLDRGIRALELDVVHDPEGGRFAKPAGLEWVKQRGLPAGPAYDPEGLMKKPGLKVLHVQDIDFRTNVYTFRQALEQLKAWSAAHPRHVPVIVTMNAKSDVINQPGFTHPLPFDKAAFDAWDAEIRAALPPAKLITPDDVRGKYATLEEAVLAHNWPLLDSVRGRFLFVLDEGPEKWKIYAEGHPSLKGRVMFVNAAPGVPEAGFLIMNDPQDEFDQIQLMVRSGYLVRTRADADTREARKNDYRRWKAARASGAHVISTDYYRPDPQTGTSYQVALPAKSAALWNPLLLPPVRPLPAVE